MADNTELNAGTGGDTIASDDIGGVKHQRVKIEYGTDGSATDVSDTNPLPVDDAGGSLTVDGPLTDAELRAAAVPVTANAGTNLNTSALALEAGGNLAAAATSLAILDDWDESDRAKVNVVAGQAGITAGAGAVGANTPRMTLASDDPAVASLAVLDNIVSGSEAQIDIVSAGPVALEAGGNLAAAAASLATLDNIVSGSEAQVDVVTQPARAATTDAITAKLATDAIQNGLTALTPKFAVIDAASSGDNTLVTGVADKKIRVLAAFLIAAGTVTARFESAAGGTALTGQMNLVANNGFVLPFNPVGWFETAAAALLNLELSGAISVDGSLVYVEV